MGSSLFISPIRRRWTRFASQSCKIHLHNFKVRLFNFTCCCIDLIDEIYVECITSNYPKQITSIIQIIVEHTRLYVFDV